MSHIEAKIRQKNRGYGAADLQAPGDGSKRRAAETSGYYDVPMLKPPVWKWQIAGYFFFGGLSAGAYVISRAAERFGGGRAESARRNGALVAAVAAIPCAPLLIHDLGHMSRFPHMLRVFNPGSPMSLGSWALSLFSASAFLGAVRETVRDERSDALSGSRIAEAFQRGDAGVAAVLDVVGVPAAIFMSSYTGILLSCTATPVWSRNAWLSPLFVASAFSTGAAAIEATLASTRESEEPGSDEIACRKFGSAARIAEGVALAGYLASAGEFAEPLTKGKHAHHTWIAVGALVLPELLHHALPGKPSRLKTYLAAGVTLAAGLSLRWGIVYAGQDSAKDPAAARLASRSPSRDSQPDAPRVVHGAIEP